MGTCCLKAGKRKVFSVSLEHRLFDKFSFFFYGDKSSIFYEDIINFLTCTVILALFCRVYYEGPDMFLA